MAARCVIVCPEYRSGPRQRLERLEAGVAELERELRGCDIIVERVVADNPRDTLTEVATAARSCQHLIGFVGGHGVVSGGEHYTALDGTGDEATSLDALWTRQLATLLGGASDCNVVLFVDTCFAGRAGLALEEALKALAASPVRRGFAVVACCRAFETVGDGVFVEALVSLLRQGPPPDTHAWGPADETIRLGALVKELDRLGLSVRDVSVDGGGELRIIPNPRYDPGDSPGRVHVKQRLRRLSAGAEDHLIDKSEGFVGRRDLRQRIVDWLAAASGGMFVVTGGPGTGKSALMGLLARQSVGDPLARAAGGPCVAHGVFDLIVHARQKTADQVADEVSGVAEARTILVDAVDEAVAGQAVAVATYLRALSQQPGRRLVVGSRPSPVVAVGAGGRDPLLAELRPDEEVNLETLTTTTADIEELVVALLSQPGSPYDGADVGVVAAEVAELTSPSFLFAHMAGRWLLGRPAITVDAAWRQRLAPFASPGALGSVIDDDLAARYHGEDLGRAQDLLRALAWGEGNGLPRYTIWPAFATVLSPRGTVYGDADVTWVLNEAGWYITEAGEDGQSVYRLFHQAFVDFFRAGTVL